MHIINDNIQLCIMQNLRTYRWSWNKVLLIFRLCLQIANGGKLQDRLSKIKIKYKLKNKTIDMGDMSPNLLITKTRHKFYILETKNYENGNVDVVSQPLSGL